VLGVAEAEGDSEELDDSVMLRLWLTLDVEDEDGDGRALRDSDCDAVLASTTGRALARAQGCTRSQGRTGS